MRWPMLGLLSLSLACSFDWDSHAPQPGVGAAASSSGVGAGGAGSVGGGGGSVGGGGGSGGACPPLFDGPAAATFGAPVVLAELGVGDDPMVSADLREIFFNADHGGLRYTIWRATRSCPTDPWSAPEEVAELDLGLEATSPALSPDGLTMFVSYAQLGTLVFDIHVTTRASRDASWSMPQPVMELNSAFADRANWIASDGQTIGLDSERSGGGDLFVATRSDLAGPWSAPVAVVELNTTADESEASPTGDLLTLVFNRDAGDGDLFRASRNGPSDLWSAQPIDELNTGADESDPWISPDGRIIVFVRGGSGATFYQALR